LIFKKDDKGYTDTIAFYLDLNSIISCCDMNIEVEHKKTCFDYSLIFKFTSCSSILCVLLSNSFKGLT